MRRFISGLLVASLLVAPLAADEGKSQSAVGTSSGGKRAMWIVIGAAAGFGAGSAAVAGGGAAPAAFGGVETPPPHAATRAPKNRVANGSVRGLAWIDRMGAG